MSTHKNDSEEEDLDVSLAQYDFNVNSEDENSLSSDSNVGENSPPCELDSDIENLDNNERDLEENMTNSSVSGESASAQV